MAHFSLVRKISPTSGEKKWFFFDTEKVRLARFRSKCLSNIYCPGDLGRKIEFVPVQFITLTYSPSHYPDSSEMKPGHDFRSFMNRMNSYRKKKMGKDNYRPMQFFRCAEHGGMNGRVHLHCVLDEEFNPHRLRNWWRKGFVKCERLKGDHRKIVNYLSKYFTKERDDEEEKEYSLMDHIDPEDRIYYRSIKGQKYSTSRSFKPFPKQHVLVFRKENERIVRGEKRFDMKYFIQPSKYVGWFADIAAPTLNSRVGVFKQFRNEIQEQLPDACLPLSTEEEYLYKKTSIMYLWEKFKTMWEMDKIEENRRLLYVFGEVLDDLRESEEKLKSEFTPVRDDVSELIDWINRKL